MTEPISVPGVYDIPADEYHRDPVKGGSLSSTGARTLLDCPARFRWQQQHPRVPTKVFDIGHAAHKEALGVGPEIVDMGDADWNTKVIKAKVAEVRAAGAVPLKTAEYQQVHDMADQLRVHPLAGPLLSGGVAEQTLVWFDEDTWVWCRAMLDYRRGRTVVDYKTSDDASPAGFRRSIAKYGYPVQRALYLAGMRALQLAPDPAFLFIAQEKEPPYLVGVYDLDDEAVYAGEVAVRRALERYRDCVASGIWPGYSLDIELISLPPYAVRQLEEGAQQ